MVHFINSCACRGGRPKALNGLFYHPRHDLLARLMKKRRYVRVLVAPSLYGKTSLALEYAETVFSFEKVFWMNGRSPCFLRDLDKGVIESSLIEACDTEGLFVVDDLPDLDPPRQLAFLAMLFEFLERDWEILITTLPSNDCFAESDLPLMRLESRDFLLPKTLIDAYRLPVERAQRSVDSFADEERIAALFWGQNKRYEHLLDEAVTEDVPDPLLLTMFTMLVLEQGCFEDILIFQDESEDSFPVEQLFSYVHLGIDLYHDAFDARSFSIALIAQTYLSLLDQITACSCFSSNNALISRLADALLGKSKPQRACELVASMTTLAHQRRWLAERAEQLMDQACFLPAATLHEGFRKAKDVHRFPLILTHAERLATLGNEEGAIGLAQRVLRARDAGDIFCAEAALVLVDLCVGQDYEQAMCQLKHIARQAGVFDDLDPSYMGLFAEEESSSEWKIRSLLEFYLHDQAERVIDFLSVCQGFDVRDRLMSQLFRRVLDCVVYEQKLHNTERRFSAFVEPMLEMVYAHIVDIEYKERFTFEDALLIRNMKILRDALVTTTYDMLPVSAREKAHNIEVKMFSQRRIFEKERMAFEKEGFFQEGIGFGNSEDKMGQVIPKISIQLFGGLCVRCEGYEIDPQLFRRKKLKALLTILAIEQGKEIPRNRLAHILWPESSPLAAQKNLHSTWSLLRKALKTPQGDCPYLTRTQLSYKLENDFIISDVAAFKDLCRNILFGAHQDADWTNVSVRLGELYRGDLLPTENENDVIIQARADYRSRLVDCCLRAAFHLVEQGEYEMSMWFSQTALEHDLTREDAYSLLMKAQIALGQRTAALDTYFSCQKHLSEKLGINPGMSTKGLYQEIIMEDEDSRATQGKDAIDAL